MESEPQFDSDLDREWFDLDVEGMRAAACRRCGAIVLASTRERHWRWHREVAKDG